MRRYLNSREFNPSEPYFAPYPSTTVTTTTKQESTRPYEFRNDYTMLESHFKGIE